jgi:hypothetical protein
MTRQGIRHSTFVVVAAALAAVLLPAAASAAPEGRGPAGQAAPQATLVRTHVFLPGPAPARTGGGKPQPAANCTNDGTSSGSPAYTGFTTAGGTAHLNAATAPSSVSNGASSVLSAAFAAWSTGGHHAPGFAVIGDGGVTKETANHRTDVLFGRTPGSAIAVTYTWHWSTGEYESDTVFSNRVPWAMVPETGDGCNENVAAYDLQDIATHEFGHIYGLDHAAGDRFATMYAYGYTGETLKRSLAASDSQGIDHLYT